MPDGSPSIKSRYPVTVIKQPTLFLEVKIDGRSQGDNQKRFVLMSVLFIHYQILLKNQDAPGYFVTNNEFLKFDVTTKVVAIHMIVGGQTSLSIIIWKTTIQVLRKKMAQ